MQGPGDHFYFKFDADKKLAAIYTVLERPEGKTEAYLQPASSEDSEYNIIAKVGPPKYIFTLPRIKKSDRQHLPTLLFSGHFQGYIALVLCVLFVFVFMGYLAS